jgi:hypothetical protein
MLTAVAAIFMMISSVSCVDLPIFLVLRGPFAAGLKESSPGLGSLYAHGCDREKIGNSLGLLHGDLLHSLQITDPVVVGVDDLDVLDVWDSIPGIAKMFHVILKTHIILLLDGLQGLSSRWMLVRALEVFDEHAT